ncbi:Dabb family protein [Hoeflea sp.]|uniref:Dabb family protein n=1 Tax=unclassified Hoeflea TaxID=2614931 RepID=UPI002B0005FA|nr:Dabb family protein [Hoeflea sp.]
MIRHTVTFSLNHEKGSDRERQFLADAQRILSAIAGVEQFEVLRQTGAKNNFSFGLSMEFADQQAYDFYNDHPDHVAFVRDRWLPEVKEFLEIDYEPLAG